MHVHPAAVGLHAVNAYALGNERAAAAERAAEVRKRLRQTAQSVEVNTDPDATLLIGQWLDSRHSQVLAGDEYHAAAEGEDPDFG
ncbi:MAG: hypothetical protein ABSA85_09610 [Terracidiphilus sp.]